MVWKGFNDCVDEAYRQWLASTMVCCAPFARRRAAAVHEEEEDDGHQGQGPVRTEAVVEKKEMEVCYDQPRRTAPPRPAPRHQRSESASSALTAAWKARSRSLASRASSQGSLLMRRNTGTRSRRPTIGAPSDFRRMPNDHSRRTEGFRPLELSIYLPRNRLSPLPDFHSPSEEPADQASLALTSHPPRTASVASHTPSDFLITRKPIHHRSFDALSMPSAFHSDWVMQPLQPRPYLSTALSSHEVGGSARKQLPRLPPSARSYSHSEAVRHVSRKGSDTYRTLPARWSRADTLDRSDIETIPALDELPSTRSSFHMMDEFNDDGGLNSLQPRVSILERPHPLRAASSHSQLPTMPQPALVRLQASPARSSTPVQPNPALRKATPSRAHVSTWLIPIPSTSGEVSSEENDVLSEEVVEQQSSSILKRPLTRSSTLSTLCSHSTLEDSPSPVTATPQSTPGRPTPIRQRTFGCGELVTLNTSTSTLKPAEEILLESGDDAHRWSVHNDDNGRRISVVGPDPYCVSPEESPVAVTPSSPVVGVAF
ncbi:MAG: hypothetical protein M1823_000969 [Watsoniomyces obsoletus]|nr:MAG: hypothetical protein M1823_000969 [Watsoniomyces obsoletus]